MEGDQFGWSSDDDDKVQTNNEPIMMAGDQKHKKARRDTTMEVVRAAAAKPTLARRETTIGSGSEAVFAEDDPEKRFEEAGRASLVRRGTEVAKLDLASGETPDPFQDDDDDSHVFRKKADSDDDEIYRPEGEVDVFNQSSEDESGPGRARKQTL